MKNKISFFVMFICAVMLLCMESTVFSFAGEVDGHLESPTQILVNNESDGVLVSWQTVENAMGYKVYRKDGESESVIIEYINTESQTSYKDTTVQSGMSYEYSVRAYNIYEESELSESVLNIYLSAPKLNVVKNHYSGIELRWERVHGAESYTVYRQTAEEDLIIATIQGEKNCSYIDKSVTDGESYNYVVFASKGNFRSALESNSSEIYVTSPKIKSVLVRNGYVRVSWQKSVAADYYKIYRKLGNGKWKELKTVNKNTTLYKDTSVKNGKTYSYRIIAVRGDDMSGFKVDGTSVKYVSPPQNLRLINSSYNGIRVRWNKVTDAKKYKVYRKETSKSNWKLIKTIKKNEFQDKNLKDGVKYIYAIKAVHSDAESYFSDSAKLLCIRRPANVSISVKSDSIALSWSKAKKCDGYKVYKKLKSENKYKLIATIKGRKNNKFEDKKVKPGEAYIYTVRAYKDKVNGGYQKKGYSVRFIDLPVLTVKHSPKGNILSWNNAKIGTGYEIYRRTQGQKRFVKYAVVKNRAQLSYTDKKPAYGKYNYYKIKVIYKNDIVSNNCQIFGINPNKKMVALTYDDGPYSDATNIILNTLDKYNSRATFFVVGSRVNWYKDCIINADKIGCEIANHTYNHTILTSAGSSTIKSEINSTNKAVKNIIGKTPTIVRAPGGSVNSFVKNTVDYPLVNWSVDTLDWKYRNSSSVVSNIKNNVYDGAIVLMHDLYMSTAEATVQIVPWLVNNGYQIVTVSEMMAVKGVDMTAGTLYCDAS